MNRARPFIFSTGLPPPCAGAVLGALDVLEKQPGLGADLLRRADVFRKRLQAEGFNTGGSVSQIVPVIIGDNQKTLRSRADCGAMESWPRPSGRPPCLRARRACGFP